jgi:hypothetical protein
MQQIIIYLNIYSYRILFFQKSGRYTSLGQESTHCGHDLLQATPLLQLLLGLGSGSGGSVNAPFIHSLHVAEQPKPHMQLLSCLPRTSTSMWKPRPPGECGEYDRS